MPPSTAPHVAQAIGRALQRPQPPGPPHPGTAGGPVQAKSAAAPVSAPARHVRQAVAAAHHPYTQAKLAGAAPPRAAPPAPARHIATALRPGGAAQRQEEGDDGGQRQKEAFARLDAARGVSSDYVTYPDLKTGGAPPPPPRRPVYTLACGDGVHCRLQDVKTGRQSDAGDFWGGFVRMAKHGPIYVSPRSGLGGPGDSHPSIASATPEGMAGRRSVVAAGEIGILAGSIVGHNDKTGHFQSRKNRRQSGLPSDLYHPFTEDPREWYRS